MVETLAVCPGATRVVSAAASPETVTDRLPFQVSSEPLLQPPITPSACTPTWWVPDDTGPRSRTPGLAPGASAAAWYRSMPSTRRWAMIAEQCVADATNSICRPPSVGTPTVGTGVQSWVCGAAHGFTPTA